MGEKDVAVPFNAVQFKTKDNNKWYPVMNTTKDALKTAPGYKYDRTAMMWMPDAPTTTGVSAPRPVALFPHLHQYIPRIINHFPKSPERFPHPA